MHALFKASICFSLLKQIATCVLSSFQQWCFFQSFSFACFLNIFRACIKLVNSKKLVFHISLVNFQPISQTYFVLVVYILFCSSVLQSTQDMVSSQNPKHMFELHMEKSVVGEPCKSMLVYLPGKEGKSRRRYILML